MRRWIDLCEGYTSHPFDEFYHASSQPLPLGTVLRPKGAQHLDGDIEEFLDRTRPANCPRRQDSIFMVTDLRALDTVLADFEHVYLVDPKGEIHCFDAVWINRLFSGVSMIENGIEVPEEELLGYARGYWSGKACPRQHGEETAFEYLCRTATVVEEIEV